MNRFESGQLYTLDGLDASGKTELTKALKKVFDGERVLCPPNWMQPYRDFFQTHGVNGRLFYYAFSNWWVDRVTTHKLIRKDRKMVFQDRSWLSTLGEHDFFGARPFWLNVALEMAKTSTKPAISFLIHVDNHERSRRLHERDVVKVGDLASLQNETIMESKYLKWVSKLEWPNIVFDNTPHTIESATDVLAQQITTKSLQEK